jgi:hypothetical protein
MVELFHTNSEHALTLLDGNMRDVASDNKTRVLLHHTTPGPDLQPPTTTHITQPCKLKHTRLRVVAPCPPPPRPRVMGPDHALQ